jgi:hypothetical protein
MRRPVRADPDIGGAQEKKKKAEEKGRFYTYIWRLR